MFMGNFTFILCQTNTCIAKNNFPGEKIDFWQNGQYTGYSKEYDRQVHSSDDEQLRLTD